MAERGRFQSQYDRERARSNYDEPPREPSRMQPREWEPREEYRREPRERYSGYYNERQFGTRGPDEREQGSRYAAEEESRPTQRDEWSQQSGRKFGEAFSPYHHAEPGRRGGGYGEERSLYGAASSQHDESLGHQLREAGQRIARKVKRVFRGPKGYKRSDERIREDVSDRLGEHEYLDCTEMEVQVSNGEVTLTGVVHSRQEKFLAEEIADDVSGVNDVHNQLRVKRDQAYGETSGSIGTTAGTEGARSRNARA